MQRVRELSRLAHRCQISHMRADSGYGASMQQVMQSSTNSTEQLQPRDREPDAAYANAKANTQNPPQHWLDRHFPGGREYLEGLNRKWWSRGIEGRCRQLHELEGRGELLKDLIEQNYQTFLVQHAHRVVDERSQTHLQVASLVLATHKSLLPFIRNEQEVLKLIRAQVGESTSPALRFLLRFTLYLSPNPYKATAHRLKAMRNDYGRAFQCELEQDQQRAILRMQKCFYHDIFAAEGLPQLTACCCCTQDSMWFTGLESHGVGYRRSCSLADGDNCCTLEVMNMSKKT